MHVIVQPEQLDLIKIYCLFLDFKEQSASID